MYALIDKVKRKCYITDSSQLTTEKLHDILNSALPKIKRLIGVSNDFDFEAEGNEEELALLMNYCWYDWNDATNEFNENYLEDINSLHHKHEVLNYVEEKNE